ncbi:amino acid/amide ABC transporter ATP-binding protein 1, HAAT family [Noviherbaspirillum humi]|uniref:Amino acid/amide ABC transporter ATP-binding protein 1, HAAT family n=1 Tax=Noviherbaspirillum humi TaxID=1688639 RepID=A0A239LAZ8_9BURK|nr:ABC transporter ATP-binding protein [Noviherbaspirillum humi]SNT27651.1 amino acid/amide ABC transporter ATP-binding protein 1, HAAT family [Noviherbaspirillum humi]
MTYALETRGLCKRFGAIQVTRNVDLKVEQGARHALIGPNGAGKTTFVNLCTGMLKPSEGAILLNGKEITGVSPQRRVGNGLVRTFQINTLFNALTVAENLAIPTAQRLGKSWLPWGKTSHSAEVVTEVAKLLDELHLLPLADKKISDLAYGQRRLVEIAIALALKPQVLLLDEPAAGIPNGESGMILDLLERLPQDISIVFIEHDMNLVFRFAKKITVLVEGAVLTEGTPAEIRGDQRVRDVYLGRRHHG